MNERIKELYKNVLASSENMRWNIEDTEKFAELIIRECISKCEIVADMAEITNTGEMARKTKATADSCARMIKQHFGVKE